MDKESSDEKLLKLIESSSHTPLLSKVPFARKIGLKQRRGRFEFKFSKAHILSRINLCNINKSLYVICVLLTLMLLYNLAISFSISKSGFLLGRYDKITFTKPKSAANKLLLSLQQYLDGVAKRNIFLRSDIVEKYSVDNVVLNDMVKDLKLVGIIWSSSPDAIIEDAVDKRTYMLKKGEMFGRAKHKIKDITRNFVVLEIEVAGKLQEYELR